MAELSRKRSHQVGAGAGAVNEDENQHTNHRRRLVHRNRTEMLENITNLSNIEIRRDNITYKYPYKKNYQNKYIMLKIHKILIY